MSSRISRVLGWFVALAVGLFYGAAATVGHAYRVGVVPIGLVLATLGCAGLLIALRTLTGDRINALAAGIGIVGATVLFSQVGPGGSAIVAAPVPGLEWIPLTWTLVAPLLVALVTAWPDLSHIPRDGATRP